MVSNMVGLEVTQVTTRRTAIVKVIVHHIVAHVANDSSGYQEAELVEITGKDMSERKVKRSS